VEALVVLRHSGDVVIKDIAQRPHVATKYEARFRLLGLVPSARFLGQISPMERVVISEGFGLVSMAEVRHGYD